MAKTIEPTETQPTAAELEAAHLAKEQAERDAAADPDANNAEGAGPQPPTAVQHPADMPDMLVLDVNVSDFTRERLAESRMIGIPGGQFPCTVWSSKVRPRDKQKPADWKAVAVAMRIVLESAPITAIGATNRSRQVRIEILGHVLGPTVVKSESKAPLSQQEAILARRRLEAQAQRHATSADKGLQVIATLSATLRTERNGQGLAVGLNRSSNIDPDVTFQAPFYYDEKERNTETYRVHWDLFAPRAEPTLTHVLRCAAALEADGTISPEMSPDHPDYATLAQLVAAGQGQFFAQVFSEMLTTQMENAERREKAQGASGRINLADIGQQRAAARGNTTMAADAEDL